jgi:hypothetical protein
MSSEASWSGFQRTRMARIFPGTLEPTPTSYPQPFLNYASFSPSLSNHLFFQAKSYSRTVYILGVLIRLGLLSNHRCSCIVTPYVAKERMKQTHICVILGWIQSTSMLPLLLLVLPLANMSKAILTDSSFVCCETAIVVDADPLGTQSHRSFFRLRFVMQEQYAPEIYQLCRRSRVSTMQCGR